MVMTRYVSNLGAVCPLLLLLSFLQHSCSSAFSTATNSPWSSGTWRLDLNFGREAGSEMPEEWGASGARLALGVRVMVGSEAIPKQSVDPTVGNGAMVIEPINDGKSLTYINSKGEQTAEMTGGGWKIDLPQGGGKGLASTLKVCLDLHNGLERNDITVSSDRLFLFAPCWREEEYSRGNAAMTPIVTAAKEAQRVLEEQLNHESGDRRLDGSDPIETIAAYKDMAQLVADRDEKKRRRREAEKIYPKATDNAMGHWPGSTELLVIGTGSILIKRRRLFGEEFQVIGKWSAVPVQQTSSEPSSSRSNVII